MKVYKFGGASVKDAESVRNIPKILSNFADEDLVIIISAMGKTTNALESLVSSAFEKATEVDEHYQQLYEYHLNIAKEIFPDPSHEIYSAINEIFNDLKSWLLKIAMDEGGIPYDQFYDQVVPSGELLSTRMVSAYLDEAGFYNEWMDARELIITDNTYRAARVDWEKSSENIKSAISGNMAVTQGFIGSNGSFSTTLGREGSDFSAAIFANVLDAEEVVVWKDVPGYLNADPQYFEDTIKLDYISYTESIELAFYGAKIIHPKTIRPLKNKGIPLKVRSFLEPESEGSVIHNDNSSDALVPSYIIKEDQVLMSISARDYSFIAEENLYTIFGLFTKHRCGINLMQNSAISFSVCVDNNPRLQGLITDLQEEFSVKYNDELRLITIRHYDKSTIKKLTTGKEILLEQRSRITVQMVIKEI
jgi:aspartate kinase